jgi:hypothetical protein
MPRTSDVFLPLTFNRLNSWPGHRPGTRTRLHAIHGTAALRAGGLSLAERALFDVCEFWSAVIVHALEWHLGTDPEQRLRSAAAVYRAMGAMRAARAMERTLGELARTHDERQRRQRIAALEVVMLKAQESVHEAIARFAMRLLPQTQETERRATAVAAVAAVVTVAGAPRRTAPSVRPAPVFAIPSPRSRPYVRWRTENRSAGQHD